MLRASLLLLAAVMSGNQTTTLITPQNQIPTHSIITPTVGGKDLPLHFELQRTGVFIDGPRVIVPCTGPSEEANMKGWRDDSVELQIFSPDWQLKNAIGYFLKVGGAPAREGRTHLRNEQTRIEMTLTQMYKVRPGEGEGPRSNEQIFRYRYEKVYLTVKIGNVDFTHKLSAYYIPVAEPVLESTRPCSDPPKETAMSFGQIGTSTGDTPLSPVHREGGMYVGAILNPEAAGMLQNAGFAVTGVDINTVNVAEPKFQDVPALKWIFLPTGTVLVPDKGGIQSMITVEPALLKGGQLQALCGGGPLAKSVAVHCLEIEKQQPDPSVKFSIARASDPGLRNLASFTQRSAVKGPWDQARIWIYADKAGLERINKRLAIGCPPGMYVRSLWEVYSMAGLNGKDLANPELFKPELLGAVCNKKEAVGWLTWVLAGNHAPALTAYLKGGAKELADLLTSTNPLAGGQFTKVMGQMLQHPNQELRLAFLGFLDTQDGAVLKKTIGKFNWDIVAGEEGEEGELGKKLKDKLG